jgi:cell wall-associated NlpC family hydrolase
MKWLITTALVSTVVFGGNYPETPAGADTVTPKNVKVVATTIEKPMHFEGIKLGKTFQPMTFLEAEAHRKQTLLERLAVAQAKRVQNTLDMRKTIKTLRKTANHTWYVYSGISPQGWDCSGLVYWTYQQLGITLKHSATVQSHTGTRTANPKPGDIVAFHYGKSYYSFHSGIYLGNGMMIHSYRKGMLTVIQSVADVSQENGNATVTYNRIIDQDPSLP